MNSGNIVRKLVGELPGCYFSNNPDCPGNGLVPVWKLFEKDPNFDFLFSDKTTLALSWSQQPDYIFRIMLPEAEEGRRAWFSDYRRKQELLPELKKRVAPEYSFRFSEMKTGAMLTFAGTQHYIFMEERVTPLPPAPYDGDFFERLSNAEVAANTARIGDHEYVACGILTSPSSDVSKLF